MKGDFKPIIYKGLPWLILGSVIVPALATATVGILMLAFWDGGRDIAFGILTICFAVFMVAGAGITLHLLFRQNKLAVLQASFMSNVSHELRTPLSSIRMFTETLKLGRVNSEEERQKCLDALEMETQHLSFLVERLLDFRKQTGAKGGEDRECVSPEELMRAVVDSYSPMAKNRLQFLAEPELPSINVNQDEAFDALSNLVKNALSHGGDGIVVVTVRSDAEGVAFHVRDTGPGIDAKEQKNIFKRFYRANERETSLKEREVSGFGLGLAIVKSFVHSHDGTVSLKSVMGRGTTFTIWLPASDSKPISPVRARVGKPSCGASSRAKPPARKSNGAVLDEEK